MQIFYGGGKFESSFQTTYLCFLNFERAFIIEELSDIESLILDFDKLEYIASAGLRIVVSAYKKLKSMNGDFSIIHVRSEVMDVFKLTGFDQKFDIQAK